MRLVLSFLDCGHICCRRQTVMMSNEEEKRCPLCAEEMDWTDQQFMPCKCGYQVMICHAGNVLFSLDVEARGWINVLLIYLHTLRKLCVQGVSCHISCHI